MKTFSIGGVHPKDNKISANAEIEDFQSQFGDPKSTVTTTYLALENEAQHLEYSWGYAVFILNGNKWQLARVEMNESLPGAPRGVGIGSSESEITAAYKDMGMLANQDGSRNLYYDTLNIGVIKNNEDGTRTVQYSCQTLASKVCVIQYHLKNGHCVLIDQYYEP